MKEECDIGGRGKGYHERRVVVEEDKLGQKGVNKTLRRRKRQDAGEQETLDGEDNGDGGVTPGRQ